MYMVARLAEVLQRLLASVSMFLWDVPIQRHVTTIQQQRVMMDHAAMTTVLHSKCLIHTVMVGMERHMMFHLTECLLLREL